MAETRSFALDELLATLPQQGAVRWIGVRPARGEAARSVAEVEAEPGKGLNGDRFKGTPASKRQVTLIQAEHLDAVASILGCDSVDPALTRRNIVVGGINLYALRHAKFRVGEVLLEGTGICAPCSSMEKSLGAGGFNAMRGHGGITARVLEPGWIRVGGDSPDPGRRKLLARAVTAGRGVATARCRRPGCPCRIRCATRPAPRAARSR